MKANIKSSDKLLLGIICFFILSNGCYSQKNLYKNPIKLDKKCFYDQKRSVTDSIKNVEGVLSIENDFYVLVVKDRKYIVCNLPKGIKNKTLLVSGYILQIMPNERLMGTPLRLSKAYSK